MNDEILFNYSNVPKITFVKNDATKTRFLKRRSKRMQPIDNASILVNNKFFRELVIVVFSQLSVHDESYNRILVLMSSLICCLLNAEC